MRVSGLLVLLTLGLATHQAWARPSNACDDSMGGDDGSELKKINIPSSGPPSKLSWVRPLVDKAIHDEGTLDAIFTFPKGTKPKHGCKIKKYSWEKLCVPPSLKKGNFRTKLRLTSNCGKMVVKYRISKSGHLQLWGRSAS